MNVLILEILGHYEPLEDADNLTVDEIEKRTSSHKVNYKR